MFAATTRCECAFETRWNWFAYFFNALAARAFMLLDQRSLELEDERRRVWVHD